MPLWWSAVEQARSGPRSPVLPVVCFLFALLVGLYVLAYTSPANLGPPVALAVRYLFFPLLGLGLALGAWSRFMPWGTARSRLKTLAWISFFSPVVAAIAYVEKSRYLVLYYEAVVLMFPFVLAAVGFVGAYRIATGRSVSKVKPATLMLYSVGMVFTNPNATFNRNPNAFLVETVKPLKPGRALDIGMGQGRNSLWLAQQGWDVTGVDISEEGVRLAQEQAAKIGVKLNTVLKSADEFDYGRDQWDLIIGIFMHGTFNRNAAKIVEGLKPGGLVVVEGFYRGGTGSPLYGRPANELLRVFNGLRITHYQDLTAPADWAGSRPREIVRLVARKE
jgi:predicted O-methyltransferase YrrM